MTTRIKKVSHGLVLLAVLLPLGARAETLDLSGNALLPSSKAFIDGVPYAEGKPNYTACLGMVLGIGSLKPLPFCPPPNGTSTQWARVIVAYVEARPERLNEQFKGLALEALRRAWPCKNGQNSN